MRVLLTGSAGFIGGAVGRLLEERGDEVVRVDAMIPQAHGATEVPPGTHRHDVREADEWAPLLDGVDVVCHQAAMVGAGVQVADLPLYASHNDLGTAVLLAAGARAAPPIRDADTRAWWALTSALAGDGMKGRDTGSPGHARAAAYVAGAGALGLCLRSQLAQASHQEASPRSDDRT